MSDFLSTSYNPYNTYFNWGYYPYFYNAQINQNQAVYPFFPLYNTQNGIQKQNNTPVNISFRATQQIQAKQDQVKLRAKDLPV